jgi:hypothetical protein
MNNDCLQEFVLEAAGVISDNESQTTGVGLYPMALTSAVGAQEGSHEDAQQKTYTRPA